MLHFSISASVLRAPHAERYAEWTYMMNEIKAYLTSPAWWFSAVLVAILINLISAYAKRLLDSIGSKMSSRIRQKFEAKRKRDEDIIETLRNSPQEQILMGQSAIQLRLRGITYYLFLIIIFVALIVFHSLFLNLVLGPISIVGAFLWGRRDVVEK